MDRQLQEATVSRANFCCEYRQLPAWLSELPFEFDHIIARKHGGRTESQNLAFACLYCNSYKGPNLSGVDPTSGEIVCLFNPRVDHWAKHFRWQGPLLVGQTPIGRVTIRVLNINASDAVEVRRSLLTE